MSIPRSDAVTPDGATPVVGFVLIGRNEGERLVAALAALPRDRGPVVYVDSGSTDASVANAHAIGATVVELDMTIPFTAARARNAGFAALPDPKPGFVQFIDGDCALQPGWVEAALTALQQMPKAALVFGRTRERFPEVSVYNRLIDAEWNVPVGKALSCAGNAMMRSEVFITSGGFNPALIAGEDPEFCLRLRKAGWEIWRIDHEMTRHDAAMTRFSQWWNRNRRAGHAYAEGAAMHGAPPERHFVRETRRAILWGGVIPAVALIGALISPLALLLLLIYPLQVLRLVPSLGLARAFFLTLGKFPELHGVVEYLWRRVFGRKARLIEYK
jgi:GT2 family glycosyltransferase